MELTGPDISGHKARVRQMRLWWSYCISFEELMSEHGFDTEMIMVKMWREGLRNNIIKVMGT